MHKKSEFLCRRARGLRGGKEGFDMQKEIILMCEKGRGEEQKKIRVTRGETPPSISCHVKKRLSRGAREATGWGIGRAPPSLPMPLPTHLNVHQEKIRKGCTPISGCTSRSDTERVTREGREV